MVLEATGGHGAERAIDASANDQARQLAVRGTRDWGRIAFVGEGGTSTLNPSPDMIHGQKTIYGSWVTSLWKMEELTEHLVRWNMKLRKSSGYFLKAGRTNRKIYRNIILQKTGKTKKCFSGFSIDTFLN